MHPAAQIITMKKGRALCPASLPSDSSTNQLKSTTAKPARTNFKLSSFTFHTPYPIHHHEPSTIRIISKLIILLYTEKYNSIASCIHGRFAIIDK
jgi:hypothetical protein